LQGVKEELQRLEGELLERDAAVEEYKIKESQFKNLNKVCLLSLRLPFSRVL